MGVELMTLLKRAWSSRWLRSVGLLGVGMLVGRFGIPLLEPRDFHGIMVHPAADHCLVEFATQTFYPWHENPEQGHGGAKVMCKDSMLLLPNVSIACVCP